MKRIRRPSIEVEDHVTTHGPQRPVRIILHSTESNDAPGLSDIRGIFNFWRAQGRGYGAHLVIDKDGNTGRGAKAAAIVWATYGANTGSYQIEMIGYARFSLRDWYRRRKQMDKVAKWCAYQCRRHGIRPYHDPVRGIAMHRDFPAGTHTDPGPHFPIRRFCRRVRRYMRNGW